MPQADTIAILGIGFSVFLGALQLKPHYRYLPILMVVGYVIILGGVIKLVAGSDPITLLLGAIGVICLGIIAGVFAVESYRSANVQDYIHIWERNFENWEGGQPDSRLDLTERNLDDKVVLTRMRLPVEKNPARFTPIFQSLHDSIRQNAHVWITINEKGLTFANDQIGEWKQVLNDTTQGGRFVGKIDSPIYAGQNKWGPDGIIKINFPIGLHKVKYEIEGMSEKGCDFRREGHFLVEIYGSTQNSTVISSVSSA